MRALCAVTCDWLTEAHEDERSSQHDSGLSSICVDDCSQTTWDTTNNSQWHTEQEISCTLMSEILQFLSKRCVKWWGKEKAHLLQCREQWLTIAAPRQGRCSIVRRAEWTMHLHTCPPGPEMHTLTLIPLQELPPGTRNLWRKSVFPPQGPGSNEILGILFYPPKSPCLVLSKSTGIWGLGLTIFQPPFKKNLQPHRASTHHRGFTEESMR